MQGLNLEVRWLCSQSQIFPHGLSFCSSGLNLRISSAFTQREIHFCKAIPHFELSMDLGFPGPNLLMTRLTLPTIPIGEHIPVHSDSNNRKSMAFCTVGLADLSENQLIG